MKLRGWRLAESYKWVKDKRPNIKISDNDTKRLQDLEVKMMGSCSAPSGFAFMSLPGEREGCRKCLYAQKAF
jgi:dual specificity MAP kinase phosphatase